VAAAVPALQAALAADARSAARSRAVLTRAGRGLAVAPPDVLADALAGVLAASAAGDGLIPGGMTSIVLSCARCCSCWLSRDLRVRSRAAAPWSAPMAVRYRVIRFSSAAMTACKVSTSCPSGGRPASGSGPANASEDRHPATASSNGSAAAEAISARRPGTAQSGACGTAQSGACGVG